MRTTETASEAAPNLTRLKELAVTACQGAGVMNDLIVTLDVREDIRLGREPFGRIMQTVGRLRPAEKLRLLAPFEPVPLFRVLAHQGFTHEARPMHSGNGCGA